MFLSWFDFAHHDPEQGVEGSGSSSEPTWISASSCTGIETVIERSEKSEGLAGMKGASLPFGLAGIRAFTVF